MCELNASFYMNVAFVLNKRRIDYLLLSKWFLSKYSWCLLEFDGDIF